MNSILVVLHCDSNTGFAIAPLELTFYQMALALCDGDARRIHFSYPSMQRGPTSTLPPEFRNYLILDPRTSDPADFKRARAYLASNRIDTIFGFDQPVHLPIYSHYRRGGVKTIVSYWGAPMSSLSSPGTLALKRIEVMLRRHGPDHYIFESRGMADTAVLGRGISRRRVSVVPQGVDVRRFMPDQRDATGVYERLAIPDHRKVFFYAGHMEPRKGVSVIMDAANALAQQRPSKDWHIALFGNRDSEHLPYWNMLSPQARDHVSFCGYRNDLEVIQRGCFAAIVASTGWDSFPRSALEAQASGLPLLASDLPGLNETIVDGETGFLFGTGDGRGLATAMCRLLDDAQLRNRLSAQARRRIVAHLSLDAQLASLITTVRAATH